MSWPDPRPGLVIRYAYLWRREHEAGREEGVKDRPCAVILVVDDEDGEKIVYVLPITHAPPIEPEDAVELPPATRTRLRLDSKRSRIVISEGNSFVWPGPDIRPAPGLGPDSAAHGMLPPALFKLVQQRFLIRVRARRAGIVKRTT